MSLMLSGTGVSRGIAIGRVRLLHEIQPRAVASHIEPGTEKQEVERVTAAMHAAITELRQLQARLRDKVPAQIMTFLDSHLLMLEDETLSQPVIRLIEEKKYTSEWALARHRDRLVAMFEKIEDSYLRQRAEDVENVIAKVLRKLGGAAPAAQESGRGYIVVTSNLAAADVLEHQHDGMRGLICSHGGTMSHAAIVARSLRIPAVTAVHPALELLHEADEVIVDGSSGMVVATPDKRSLQHYRKVRRDEKQRQRDLKALAGKPACTLDGITVSLQANVDSPSDAGLARRVGAEGVGLYRSDSLFANRDDLPDENEQVAIYRRVVRAMHGRPVTLRTLDAPPAAFAADLPHHAGEPEPVLGLRGIRLSLAHPELFEPQVRAMLRASSTGPVRILLPMISSVTEVQLALTVIERIRLELLHRKRAIAEQIPIGALIEVPGAALAARQLIKHVDFFAIGSNDLTQYTLAAAREDDDVQHLYDPLHPAVLRLISEVIAVGDRANKPVVLCGELGSDPRVCRLLLGLGLRHLSVHPATLLEVKDSIRHTDVGSIKARARRMLSSDSRARTERLLNRLVEDN